MQDIQTVVDRCQEGQLDAFTTLFSHFKSEIYDLAYTILRDDGGAEDVVQDTFLAVFQKIDGFRGDSSFKTWLTAIAVNECRMRLRKRKVRQLLSFEQLSPRWLSRLSGQQQDVVDEVHRRRQRHGVWDTVDQLDERLRLPIILRYRYDLSCSDIATILNLRTSTIYQQLHEGRRRLEQMLQQQESDDPAITVDLAG